MTTALLLALALAAPPSAVQGPAAQSAGPSRLASSALASNAGSSQDSAGAPAGGPAATARDSALDAETRAIAEQLRCPVCQGVSIEASPTDLAREMRRVVRDQLAAGRTPNEVKAYFVSKYGEWILLQPKAKGFNLTVYLLPFAVLLGGAALIAFAVRRWTGPREDAEEDADVEEVDTRV